jgi:hypothetical protein
VVRSCKKAIFFIPSDRQKRSQYSDGNKSA